MAKHTQGPWKYQEESDKHTHIVRAKNDYMICHLSQDTSGISEANARLIASAPELLEACKKCYSLLFNGIKQDLVKELKQVIAKAEGK